MLKNRDIWSLSAFVILAVGLVFQLRFLFISWRIGGQEWLQGDWLISLAAGPIRRGILGEAILRVSDLFMMSPLELVIGIQLALVMVVFIGFARLLELQASSSMALVVFTPGCFAILWALDPISGLRKELIGIAALIWLAQPAGNTRRMVLSGLMMVVGGLGHEIVILLAPAWVIALYLFQPDTLRRPFARVFIVGIAALAIVEAAYALHYKNLADTLPLCDALTTRGLSATNMCGGAIQWLSDPQNGFSKVWAALHRSWTSWLLPLAWLIAAAPLWRIWTIMQPRSSSTGWLLLIAIAPLILLCPVGLDWGRWFAVQLVVASTLMLGLGLRGDLVETGSISPLERATWLGSCLLWGFLHDPTLTARGFLVHLISLV